MADEINMSGDFRGAIVNVKSHLKNVTQTIGSLQRADEDARQELKQLVAELQQALEAVPSNRAQDAEKVALRAKQLAETAAEEKPDRELLEPMSDGLKKAATAVADVVPTVLPIALRIAEIITQVAA